MALPSSASAGERWPPLESSPDVFNQFMWSLGVPGDEAEFHDVYGLDADALEMVPQPVVAVILCFPDPPSQDAINPSERVLYTGDKGTIGGGKDHYALNIFVSCLVQQETWDQVYFIQQIESLGNACGTIGLLHAVGNASSEISLVDNSCLDLFFKSTARMDPYERAVYLEKDDAMTRAHSLAASAGVTELCDVVEEHYICFVAVNGTLYELDGMKHGPIKHGSSSSKSLLQDAVHVIKAIMLSIPNSINFNVMALSRKARN
ncbi:ubiquitin carboxyl-terminal hydrolase 3-like isoform X1 [Phragmites australis]|uniref:ubiquitin carboxyl-terminal hydrolase 3-like isoform X1 n=1 Tax=Phragmites australis TaxID=29695 RepID=UPI002D7822D1|nr:ubiquitin carboxyl-terminal hydrolase 3-like isoform X1 [Phragmites australis]